MNIVCLSENSDTKESSNTLKKRVIFKFEIGSGGIGDLTKFFSFLLSYYFVIGRYNFLNR